ncbi:response regulator transcription factor [Candidatus Nomurabacteria bacterium]|nr:response regulator transcription factor [Candidatus Nomurabacteria bacterium]
MNFQKKTVLFVDSNKAVLGLLVSIYSSEDRLDIYTASSLSEALSLLERKHFDLVSTELSLPDGNGREICKYASDQAIDKPKVIVLSQGKSIQDRIQSFEAGADDYISKPFHPEELKVRMMRLLNLIRSTEEQVVRHQNLELYTVRKAIKIGDSLVKLTRNEFYLCEILLANPGYELPNEEIIRVMTARKGRFVSYNSLRVSIKRLRDKIETQTGYKLIQNRHGQGYFIAI